MRCDGGLYYLDGTGMVRMLYSERSLEMAGALSGVWVNMEARKDIGSLGGVTNMIAAVNI